MKNIFYFLILFIPLSTQADFVKGANLANEGKFEEANIEFQKGIDAGEAKSYFGLGSAYYFGDGVDIDYKKAYELFEEGARKNNGESAFMIAMMHSKGQHVTPDEKEYLKYIKQAANSCIPQAQHQLGYLLMDGKLLEKNDVEAAAWFMTAYWIDGDNQTPLGDLLNQMTSEQNSQVIARQKEIISNDSCETYRY
jgi:TPR repeat protein